MNRPTGGAALAWAWAFFCLALPLSVAGANIGWGLVLATLAWAARLEPRAAASPLLLPFAVYCGACALSATLALDAQVSLKPLTQDLHKLWLCALFAAGLSPLDARARRRMLAALALGFAATCAYGVWQVFSAPAGTWVRARGSVHPVTFGELAALAALGAFCFLLEPPDFLKPRPARLAATLLLLLCTTALLLSQTRGAILGAASGAALLCLPAPRLRRPALGALAVVALVLVASDLLPTKRSLIKGFLRRAGPESYQLQDQLVRFELWRGAWAMFRERPWTGVGPNNFRARLPSYERIVLAGEPSIGTAHNLYLHQLAERGLAGAAALLFLLWRLWAGALARARASPDAWNLWAFASVAAFLVMNLTETALQVEQVWMLLLFLWLWAWSRGEARAAG